MRVSRRVKGARRGSGPGDARDSAGRILAAGLGLVSHPEGIRPCPSMPELEG